MRVACLFSGGKDSVYATWIAASNAWEIERLITMYAASDSHMFHHPNVEWCKLQAQAMQLPITFYKAREGKEQEVEDLKKTLEELEIDGVVSGALASEYQKEKIDFICEKLGLKSFAPLWHKNQKQLMRELVENGFEIIISSVSAEGLGKEWLGKKIDEKALKELEKLSEKLGFNPAFEGGEAETIVLNAPFFKKKIKIKKATTTWNGNNGEYAIEEAELV